MNDPASWQKENERYLAAALTWLRLCLARLAERDQAGSALVLSATPSSEPFASSPRRRFLRQPPVIASMPAHPSLPPRETVSDQQVDEAAQALESAEAIEPPPTLILLSQRFNLSRFERNVLLLCAAMELDTRIAGLCARAQDDPIRRYPTFALALALFEEGAWDVLSPERPLRYWRLIEINQPGTQPLTTSPLRADERIVNYLKGLNYLDDRLVPLLAPLGVEAGDIEPPPSQQAVIELIVRHLEQSATMFQLPVVQLLGADVPSKHLVAWRAAKRLGLHLYRLPAEVLPSQATELETFARLWRRESILLPIALYLDAYDAAGPSASEGQSPPLNRFLARSDGLFFLDTRDVRADVGRSTIALDITKPAPAEQQAAWQAVLGPVAAEVPARLAGQFNLSLATIQQIAQSVRAETPEDDQSELAARLWDACRSSVRPGMDALAERLDPKATWDDIVLPDEEMGLLRQIADQVEQRNKVYEEWGFARKMNRGLGISVLFAGESGTGKTMAAEVLANHLRLNLYRIDLSAVVSKYIGETEKNLRRVFDAAEDGGAILFFDEADALFGKRSEVKDSHDRYANIEINYLLQRMEGYRGLAILATNMKSAMDIAFMRRLRFVANFAFPNQADRKRIWQRVFPQPDPRGKRLGLPLGQLDYDRLARLNLTGGSIHNVALNAAFLAAHADAPLTMSLVLAAARAEFRKLDRPINEADFRWTERE